MLSLFFPPKYLNKLVLHTLELVHTDHSPQLDIFFQSREVF